MVRLRFAAISSCLVLGLACSFDSSGIAGSLADESGTGSDTSADTHAESSQETSDSGSTTDGDGDGDPSTGDGDGDPATGDGDGDGDPTTGDGDGDPTTGDGDGDLTTGDGDGDGDGDPTTGDDDGDGDGDPTTGDGDGDPAPEHYSDCPNDDDNECVEDEYCLDPTLASWRVCTMGCEEKVDCPAGPPGSNPVCIPISGNTFNKGCFLNCNGDDVCPEDMHCQGMNLNLDKVCVYKD
jgi:hypothetical protein